MARSSQTRLIPSTGVLLAALLAAIVAAILINVYANRLETKFWAGAFHVLQLKENVNAGDPVRARHLRTVKIVKAQREAFTQAVTVEDRELVLDKPAPRNMLAGEFLWYFDWQRSDVVELPVKVEEGYELVTVLVSTDRSPGRQLRPGAYVNLWTSLYRNGKDRKGGIVPMAVLKNAKVAAINGLTKLPEKGRGASYDNIQIQLDQSQTALLMEIMEYMADKRFKVNPVSAPARLVGPEFSDEVMRYLERLKTPGGDLMLD